MYKKEKSSRITLERYREIFAGVKTEDSKVLVKDTGKAPESKTRTMKELLNLSKTITEAGYERSKSSGRC